jgi:hypothetical protein
VTQKEIRVGIVGADAKASWAKLSHVPAIKGLSGVRLAAVATRNERSAREAAEAFGPDRWYFDPFEMIRDDRIDIVTIAVKVPAHRDLVLMALAADKAVYCEAPLGCSVSKPEDGAFNCSCSSSGREASRAGLGSAVGTALIKLGARDVARDVAIVADVRRTIGRASAPGRCGRASA